MTRVSVSPVSLRWWMALPEPERQRIEAAVPPDRTLVIKPGWRAKPGTCDVSLRDEWNDAVGQEQRGRNIAWMCWAVLPGVVVTTDGAGYVKSIEDVG